MARWQPSVDPMVPMPDLSFGDADMDESFLDRLGRSFAANPMTAPPPEMQVSPLAAFLTNFGARAANDLGERSKRRDMNSPRNATNRLALGQLNLKRAETDRQRADADSKNRTTAAKDAKAAEKERIAAAEMDPDTPEGQAKIIRDATREARTLSIRRAMGLSVKEDSQDPYKQLPGESVGDWRKRVLQWKREDAAATRAPEKPVDNSKPNAAKQEQAKYSLDTANRTIAAIDEVLPDIGGWTTGAVGTVLGAIPGTPAKNVQNELSAVASNIAFNALQEMRNASKTGGALGQVSERELDLLSSVQGAIQQSQSASNLKKQLGKVRDSMEYWKFSVGQEEQGLPIPSKEEWLKSRGQAAPASGAVRWGRDANGRPVPSQ